VNNRPDDGARAYMTALTDIHLHSAVENDPEPQGDARTVRLLALTALLVLLIACINYMNLSTARSMRRAREIGVRKVAGAGRVQLLAQFMGESVLTVLCASLVAIVFIGLTAGPIRELTGKPVMPALLNAGPLLSIVLLAVLVGLAAGSYPALILSRFQPARVLKGAWPGGGGRSGGRRLRQGLVTLQFAVSVILVIGALSLLRQMRFIRSAGLGFEDEQVLVVDVRDARLRSGYEALRERWKGLTGVRSVGMSASTVPGQSHSGSHTMRRPGTNEDAAIVMERNWVDAPYLETLGIEFIAGRPFRMDPFEEDAVVLNETAVRKLGWSTPREAVGQTVLNGRGADETPLRVTGVVRDYHYESLHRRVGPLMLSPYREPSKLVVRIAPRAARETLARLRDAWRKMSDTAFIYTFLDDDIQRLYEADVRRGRLLTAGGTLAVLIACLGLLGLAAFTVDRRRREIGVRKVLGASAGRIVLLVTREFLAPVAAAVVIAVPAAVFVANVLVRDFAYRPPLGVDMFVLGGGLLLVTAALTVSLHALRAARTDPVRTLRSE
jgi:putative ABC transport system permease protein